MEFIMKQKKDPEGGTEVTISLSELLEIRNSMEFTPILKKERQAHKHGITSVCCHGNPIFFALQGMI